MLPLFQALVLTIRYSHFPTYRATATLVAYLQYQAPCSTSLQQYLSNQSACFSPDIFPHFYRMQRVGLVAQYAVFDTSSAAMTEHSHGLKPTLPNHHHCHYLIPQFSTFQAAVGLDRRGSTRCLFSVLVSIRPHKTGGASGTTKYPRSCSVKGQ